MGALIVALLGLGLFISGSYFAIREILKNRHMFTSAWRRMESFETASLKVGVVYYFALEALKTHPAKDNFISGALTSILAALAEALFILGIIAFLKHAHDIKKENP